MASLLARMSELESNGSLVPELSPEQRWSALVDRVRADIRAQLCPEQLALFEDPNPLRAACCARQSGKTFTVARLMVDTAISGPDRIVWYVSDTVERAVGAMWDDQVDGLPAVLDQLGLVDRRHAENRTEWHYEVNLTQHKVTFRNGSFIRLRGADRSGWTAFRGRQFNLLVIDEMQRQEQDALSLALEKDLPDCRARRLGSIVCIGTVGRALKGVWYELSHLGRQGWTKFHWTAKELSHLTNVWEQQLAQAVALGIDTETDSEWIREKLGIWVRDGESLVHVVSEASLWDGGQIPERIKSRCVTHTGPGMFACTCERPLVNRTQTPVVYAGLDLGGGEQPGQGDPCAVWLGSISVEEGALREVWSEQRHVQDSDELGRWLRGLTERLHVALWYVDPAWKITANDLSRLHGLTVGLADKGDKDGKDEDFWHAERRMALRQGTLQLIRGGSAHDQFESVLRDSKELDRGRIRAAPGQDDHVFDCVRYCFRMVRTNHVKGPEAPMTQIQRDFAAEAKFKERMQRPQVTPGFSQRRPMPGSRR